MIITKAAFCNVVNSIQSYMTYLDKIEETTGVSFRDVPAGELIDKMLISLSYSFDPSTEQIREWVEDDISWFCFENDFGNYNLTITRVLDDGEIVICPRTSEDIYDYIITYVLN